MKPEERKSQIIEAAIKCFANRGYHSTSISHIIDEASVARGTFYLYFKSKHEIFQSILDEFTEHIGSQIKTIEMSADLTPAAQMKKNVERVVDAVLQKPEVGQILFNEAVGLDEETQKRLKEFYNKLITRIQSSIQLGISFGLVRDVDPKVASCIALGGVREILTQSHIFKNANISRDAMVDGLIDVLFGGISPKLISS
jgi:AcrR family transcriptional regulator